MEHFAIKHPVVLEARLLSENLHADIRDLWILDARGATGNRISIIASGQRFRDAFRPHVTIPSPLEQVRNMYLRGEIDIASFESEVERHYRQYGS